MLDEASPDSAVAVVLLDLAAGRASRASFFAQPLPLKWMFGVDISLRIGPPQLPQAVGPASFTP